MELDPGRLAEADAGLSGDAGVAHGPRRLSGADACLTVSSVPSESDAYLWLQDSLI